VRGIVEVRWDIFKMVMCPVSGDLLSIVA
jgi:hypothetical protein